MSDLDSLQPVKLSTIKRPIDRRFYHLLTEEFNGQDDKVSVAYQDLDLVVDFEQQRFYCDFNLLMLTRLCKAKLEQLQISILSDDEFIQLSRDKQGRDLKELLWCAALFGFPGELFEPIDAKTCLTLKRWPNTRVFVHLPIHINIAAFMSQHETTIEGIASQTSTKIENVFDYVNACLALGYLKVVDKCNVKREFKRKESGEITELFNKLRAHLRIKS